MNIKRKGSFYTPEDIALWMSERVLKGFCEKPLIDVLEPSFGDGVFIKSVLSFSDTRPCCIDAVEYDKEAFRIVNEKYKKHSNLINEDFLFCSSLKKYDIVIGNPPYIVKKRLNKTQSEKCKDIHLNTGMKDREVANIWTSFLLKSSKLLKDEGVLGFVLPTELLQVNYTQEIRRYLLSNFERLEIVSFKKLAFKDIQQDTVILIAYKKAVLPKGLYFAEVSSVNELSPSELLFEEHHGNHDVKWSSYILSESDMSFIKDITSRCKKISDLCTSVAGIVTAANGYFIVTQDDVDAFELEGYVKKIIQKGMYVNGSVELLEKDYSSLKSTSKPCYLIDLNGIPESNFSKGLMEYLTKGVDQKIHERYKCKLRKRWYDVPSIWKSEGLFFKRGHHYPKLLVNKANVHVTDAAYRINMKEGYDIESLAASFYNSLTLLYSELSGRYYGGGVLEITPNEFKQLPIPKYQVNRHEYKRFVKNFKEKSSIEQFVQENDHNILSAIPQISKEEICLINELYKKVKNRRLRSTANENYT